jgi:hypothetical protein
VSLATPLAAALTARPRKGHGPHRPRSLNAPDTDGDFTRAWQPLSRRRIEISGLDLVEPPEAVAAPGDPGSALVPLL